MAGCPQKLVLLAVLAGWLLLVPPVLAQSSVRLDFEGPEPSWHDLGGDARHRFDAHQRVAGAAQSGDWCEHVRVVATNGTYAYLGQTVAPARVIDELKASVWVKSDRAGLQILGRVVLPRSLDPASGAPRVAFVRGSSYARAGVWQQLHLEDLPRLVEREAVLLRTRFGPDIDAREAYLDAVVLNVYGGPGATHVWIDDLELSGVFGTPPGGARLTSWSPAGSSAASAAAAKIELNGSLVLVDGKPFFLRAVEYHGEPLEFLKKLGFNAVKLASFPPPALLAEANDEGMWLVCPPPVGPETLAVHPGAMPRPNSPGWNRILVWHLGEALAKHELERTRLWAEQLRRVESELARPLVCDAESQLRPYSRQIDILSLTRFPLGTSLELADYARWLRERPRLALPGKPIWTTIQTELDAASGEQLALLSAAPPVALMAEPEQLRLLVASALATGVRGICFASSSRLDAGDAASRRRAATLELINLELELIEPWCAAGTLGTAGPSANPEVHTVVLQTDRTRLLIPFWSGRGAQCVPGQLAGNGLSFTVPVPESSDAYELTPGGLRPLRHRQKRVPGGTNVTLDEFGLSALVLFAHDPVVINSVSKKLAQRGRRIVELQRELTAMKLASVSELDRQLASVAPAVAEAPAWLASAQTSLTQGDAARTAGDLEAAHRHACRATRALRLLERAHWNRAVEAGGSLAAVPGLGSGAALPHFWTVIARLRQQELGLNRLPEGGFENLRRLTEAGWRHFKHPHPGLETEAHLVADPVHAGRFSLQLRAWAADKGAPQEMVETPPIWITSAPVLVEAGQLVRIHGWVQVPEPLAGTVDGLMIFDSLGGRPLAERIGQTTGWKEFTLYRAAPRSGPVTVTIALTGLGTALVDDVTIEPLVPRQLSRAH